jgi:PAS domain S-box-containing protein
LPACVALLAGLEGLPAADPLDLLAERWRWRLFDRDEGLSSNAVLALYQDRDDYLYAATDRGLCRYDLHRWEEIHGAEVLEPTKGLELVESLEALFYANASGLWAVQAGTPPQRLYPPAGAAAGRIFVAGGRLGDIFIIDDGQAGALQFQLRGRKLEPLDDGVRLPPGRILAYQLDKDRVHWLATSLGLYFRDLGERRWNEVDDRRLELPFGGAECLRLIAVEKRSGPPEPVPRGGHQPPEGHELWGLFQPAGAAGRWCLARLERGIWIALLSAAEGPPIEHVVRDPQGNYYATCEDGRLFLLRAGDREWSRVDRIGLGQVKVHGGLLDSTGNLWFRLGAGGVAYFELQSRRWESLPGPSGRPYSRVLSLLETAAGEIWVGTAAGVLRYRSRPEGSAAPAGAPELYEKVLGTPLREISGLAEDSEGHVWIASAEAFGGAFYHDGSTWAQAGFSALPIRRIVADRPRKELWFLAGQPEGPEGKAIVYRRSAYTGHEFQRVEAESAPVADLLRSGGDAYWLATDDGLLECRLGADRLAFTVKRRFGEKEGLHSKRIWAVTQAADGAIWVCYPSSGRGVSRILGDEVRSFDVEDGLASPGVLSIVSAGPNLWFGTERGLSRYDGECWYSFPIASADPQTSWVFPILPSQSPDEPNSLLVGTLAHGVLRFRMDDRRRPRFSAQSLPRRADRDGRIELAWDARDYKNQTRPQDLLFRSRLDGGRWTPFGPLRKTSFAGLAPGQHTFEVEVRDLDGNRNREELVHRFEIESPASGWPALGGALGAAALFLLLIALSARRSFRARHRLLEHCRGLFLAHPGAVLFLDGDGRITHYNGAAPALLGLEGARREDILGRPLHLIPALSGDDLRRRIRRLLAGEEASLRELRRSAAGGAEQVLEISAFPLASPRAGRLLGAAVVVEDRTREAEEERLVEREKRLAGLRDFAGRIAENVSDLLCSLESGNGGALEDAGLRERLRRAAEVARDLMLFSGRSSGEAPAGGVELESVLGPLLGLDGRSGSLLDGRSGRVHADYRGQTGLWPVFADPELLSRALREVLENALDAMAERGRLTVRAANLRLDEDPGRLPPGSYVEVSVKDEGPGIEPARLELIFDPLYSTKASDRAQGLGLSLAYGMLRSQGGDIRVQSRPGAGTTVRLLLPASRR